MARRELLRLLVFVVSNDRQSQRAICGCMESAGYRTEVFGDPWSAIRAFEKSRPDVVIMNFDSGFTRVSDMVKSLHASDDTVQLIALHGEGSEEAAVASIRDGAFDYHVNPPNRLRLLLSVQRAGERRRLENEVRTLRRALARTGERDNGDADTEPLPMREIEKQAISRALSQSNGNVSRAARRLGLGRTTLYRKMSTYGLMVVSPRETH
jgi:DNA-binding NtrC family response regulator